MNQSLTNTNSNRDVEKTDSSVEKKPVSHQLTPKELSGAVLPLSTQAALLGVENPKPLNKNLKVSKKSKKDDRSKDEELSSDAATGADAQTDFPILLAQANTETKVMTDAGGGSSTAAPSGAATANASTGAMSGSSTAVSEAASTGSSTLGLLAGVALLGAAAGGGGSTPATAVPLVNTLNPPVVNATTKAAGLTVTGTTEAGSVVTVKLGNTEKTAVTTGTNWTVTFAAGDIPADGSTTLSAVAKKTGATDSTPTAAVAITVDTAVAAPVVGAVATDNAVSGAEKTAGVAVSGTADAGASVAVTWGATTKTVTATGGNWTTNFASTEIPADGNTSVNAVATDVVGNVSVAGTRAVTVDTTVAAPVVTAVATDNVVNGAEKTAGVAVSGTAEAGASVAVTWGATTKTVTATGGNWTANFTSAQVPADGNTSVSAVATDVLGNVSVAGTRAVTVDTAVAAPVVGAVATDNAVSGAEKTAGVAVSGTAEAGASVAVTWGATTKTVTATGGNWTTNFASTEIPADGNTSVSAVATDVAGNVSVAGTQAVTVDTATPTITSLVADSATQKISLTYSEALDALNKPEATAFTVSIGGVANLVASVAVSGSTVVLTMTNPIPTSGAVSVAYQDPTNADDVAAIQDAVGNDAASFANVVVADGYIRGANVYIDTNNNGRIDVGADTFVGVTDKNGNILIPGNLVGGTLLVQGGVNIDTGVANTAVLKAPKGSTSITPLTTLVQTVVEQQVAANPNTVVDAAVIQTAMAQVASALGLTTALNGKSLTSYDPIAQGNTVVQKAAAQVATIVALASGGDEAKSAEVMSSLTTRISSNGTAPAISLDDATVLNSILPSSLSLSDAKKSEITAASTSISTAANINAISTAQGQSLDKTAAAKPTLDAPALTNKPSEISVKVLFENKATDGSSVITGDTIQLKDGSVAVGAAATVTADDLALGFKVIKVSFAGAADSAHSLTASITDKAGNVSPVSLGSVVTVDTAVEAPEAAAVATDNTVNAAEKTASVAVSGTAEAGASVAVTWGATTKTVTATGGNWTTNFASTEVPADGNTSVSAVATDVAGNVSVAGTKSVTVDTAAAAPVVAAVNSDNFVNAEEKTAGVAVSGSAEAGASVAVTWGATTKTVTATGGSWTADFASTEVPADGNTSVSAVATDVAGNVSVAGTKSVTVDTAVAAPVVAAVNSDNFVNAAEKTAGVVVSGTAEAGASVAVTWGATTKTATATGGNWTANFASAEVPADGNPSVSAVATDVAGNMSVAGTQAVTVDSASPTATATIRTVEDNVPSTTVTEVAKGSTTNDNTPALVGDLTAALGAGEVLAVYDGATRIGQATVTNTAWNFVATSLSNGDHSLTAVVEDIAGNLGAVSGAYAFKVDATVPAATAAVTALAASVNTDKPAITGTVTGTLATGDVVKVFDGSTLLGTATVSGSAWSFTPTSALAQGQHKITAVVENAGGTQSALSAEKAFVVDTVAPVVPVVSSFSDNSGLTTDNITNDKTLTFSMTAEAGSKLEVFSGTTSLGTATESSTAGTFSFTTASLADGTYSFKAGSSDAAGNSTLSAVKAVVIDATAPAKSVITDWVTDGSNIKLVISAETGSEVTVSKGTVVLGTATETSTKGIYNYTAPIESAGIYGFTTKAKDVAGNVSADNTQSAIFVSGDSLQTITSGSVDLKVVSSTATALTLALSPKFTNTGISSLDAALLIDSSKVTFPESATSNLNGFSPLVGSVDVPNSTIDSLNIGGYVLDAPATSVTSSVAIFALSWKSSPAVLDINFASLEANNPSDAPYTGLTNPSFRFTPGNGVATGTTGDDLIITGTGNVSVTGGAGADTVLLGNSAVNLTLTDFAFGTDHIDLSKLMMGSGYTSTAATAAANVGVMLAPTPSDIATLITSKDASLDNKFGAWFEAATTGTNKGVLHVFGDNDAAVGAGRISPYLVDIVIGANSTGTYSLADLFYQLPPTVVI
ncbi:Ig-like domain-containing protein [Limnohabitans sp. Rim8]|uniref:beta strand repeat-containing protein n=1 Tax=Limnohabitans sp. Rim8 TaxID=1100718 RepID=UPI003305D8B9